MVPPLHAAPVTFLFQRLQLLVMDTERGGWESSSGPLLCPIEGDRERGQRVVDSRASGESSEEAAVNGRRGACATPAELMTVSFKTHLLQPGSRQLSACRSPQLRRSQVSQRGLLLRAVFIASPQVPACQPRSSSGEAARVHSASLWQ